MAAKDKGAEPKEETAPVEKAGEAGTTREKKRGKAKDLPCRRAFAQDPKAQQVFLDALADLPNITRACKLANVGRDAPYALKESDPKFAAKWARAWRHGIQSYADRGISRGYEQSDTMMIFMLKKYDPERFGDVIRTEHTGKDGGPIVTINATVEMTPPELEAAEHRAAEYVQRAKMRELEATVVAALPAGDNGKSNGSAN